MNASLPDDESSLWERFRQERRLTPELCDGIVRLFGEGGKTALRAVQEGQVKKYLDFFIVVGRNDEYVVDEEFCTCRAQVFRGSCWHVLAARIAELTGQYEEIDEWYLDTWKG